MSERFTNNDEGLMFPEANLFEETFAYALGEIINAKKESLINTINPTLRNLRRYNASISIANSVAAKLGYELNPVDRLSIAQQVGDNLEEIPQTVLEMIKSRTGNNQKD